MKKRLLFVISLILALVMSFALIACGGDGNVPVTPGDKGDDNGDNGDNGDGGEHEVTVTMDNVMASLEKIGDADSVKLGIKAKTDSEKADPIAKEFELELRGDSALVTFGKGEDVEQYLMDTSTGMLYAVSESEKQLVKQFYPQGMTEYINSVLGGVEITKGPDVAKIKAAFTYNKDSKTFSATFDESASINSALEPLYTVYEDDGSIEDLIDEYLYRMSVALEQAVIANPSLLSTPLAILAVMFKEQPPTLESLFGMLTAFVVTGTPDVPNSALKDKNILQTAELVAKTDLDKQFEEFLTKLGMQSADIAKAKSRTVGEGIEGILKFFGDNIDLKNAQASIAEFIGRLKGSKADRNAILAELINDIFVAEVDAKNLENDMKSLFGAIVDLARNTKLRGVIDGLPSDGMAAAGVTALNVFKECVKNSVTFKALKADAAITLDADNEVEKIVAKFTAEHSYDGESALPFLSDNGYIAELEIDILDVVQTASPFDFGYATAAVAVFPKSASAIGLISEDDYTVYYESGDYEITVKDIAPYYVGLKNEILPYDGQDVVTYDAANKSFVIDSAFVSTVLKPNIDAGNTCGTVGATATVEYNGVQTQIDVMYFAVLDGSPAAMGEVIQYLRPSIKDLIPSAPADDVVVNTGAAA